MNDLYKTTLLLITSSFPYIYFAMSQDIINNSIKGYLFLVLCIFATSLYGRYKRLTKIVVIGNIISTVISYWFVQMDIISKAWQSIHYFKPFTVNQFFICMVIMSILVQMIAVKIIDKNITTKTRAD